MTLTQKSGIRKNWREKRSSFSKALVADRCITRNAIDKNLETGGKKEEKFNSMVKSFQKQKIKSRAQRLGREE